MCKQTKHPSLINGRVRFHILIKEALKLYRMYMGKSGDLVKFDFTNNDMYIHCL